MSENYNSEDIAKARKEGYNQGISHSAATVRLNRDDGRFEGSGIYGIKMHSLFTRLAEVIEEMKE